jgi:hypothetical protein
MRNEVEPNIKHEVPFPATCEALDIRSYHEKAGEAPAALERQTYICAGVWGNATKTNAR